MKARFPSVPVGYPLYIGCTASRAARLGINAIVNARGGQQWRNDVTPEDINIMRDAQKIRDRTERRVRFYQLSSRWFRRRASLQRLLSRYDD